MIVMELNFFDLLSDREKWKLWEQGRGDLLVIWGRTLFDSLANTTLLYGLRKTRSTSFLCVIKIYYGIK